jgi:dTDP-4-dehydrorhamnose reductase
MILLLGATGCVGQAFASELRRRGSGFIPLSRSAFDYTRFELLFDYVRKMRPDFVINAAGFSGRPSVDACEAERMETFQANTLLPQTISRVCLMTNTPWGHVSSGGIYAGAKFFDGRQVRLERDLNRAQIRELFESHPERFLGFTELDEPNFTFRSPPCSFLAGTKALAEEALRGTDQSFIWRLRLPFGERDEPWNLLTKLQRYRKVYDHVTSLSHLDDFVRACLDLVERRAAFGIYNLTNPGAVTTRQVVEMIQRILKPPRNFEFWADDEEFYSMEGRAPRSNCILDSSKLLRAGIKMRRVEEALEDCMARWAATPANSRRAGHLFETSLISG